MGIEHFGYFGTDIPLASLTTMHFQRPQRLASAEARERWLRKAQTAGWEGNTEHAHWKHHYQPLLESW